MEARTTSEGDFNTIGLCGIINHKTINKMSYKKIKLEHTSNDLQESRTANISAFHYNCEIGYGVTFKPENQDTEGIIWLRYTTDRDRSLYFTSHRLPNWKDAPVAWAFAVEALETTDIEPKHIRAYIEDLEKGTPLAPFKVK